MEPNNRRSTHIAYVFLIAILIIIVSVKLSALRTGLWACDGDEAIIGIMAKHAAQGKSIPVYMYGQAYGAGAGGEARLVNLGDAFFKASDIGAIKIAALIIFTFFIFTFWIAAWRSFGKFTANAATLLMISSPTMSIWFSKLRGGHILALAAMMLAYYIGIGLIKNRDNDKAKSVEYFLFGLISACAVWTQPLTAAPVAVLIFFAIVSEGAAIFLKLRFWLILLGAALISIPPIYMRPDNVIWGAGAAGYGAPSLQNVWAAMRNIPGLFEPYLDKIYPPAAAWIKCVSWFWLSALLFSAWLLVKSAIKKPGRELALAAFLVIAPVSATALSFFVSYQESAPRNIIAAFPFACLIIGAALGELYSGSKNRKIIGASIAAILFVSAIAVNAKFLGEAAIYGAGTQQMPMPARVVTEIINKLDARGIRYLYCLDYMLKWNITYESDERIITRGASERDRYQPYVDAVNKAISHGEVVPTLVRLPLGSDAWKAYSNASANSGEIEKIGEDIFILWGIGKNIEK